jgi:hypothetical protein
MFMLEPIYNTGPHLLAKDMGHIMVLMGNILGAYWVNVVPPHCFSRISISNLFIIIFGLDFYKSLSIYYNSY